MIDDASTNAKSNGPEKAYDDLKKFDAGFGKHRNREHRREKWQAWRQTIFDRIRGQWCAYYQAHHSELAEAASNPGKHVGCPNHSGKTCSNFRLFADADQSGGGVCNSCGTFPTGFKLLKWLKGWEGKRVFDDLAKFLNIDLPSRKSSGTSSKKTSDSDAPARGPTPQREQASSKTETPTPDADILRNLEAFWARSKVISSRVVAYLQSRKLSGTIPGSLGFNRKTAYYDANGKCLGYFPAIIGRMESVAGKLVALHKIYLATAGDGKAPLDPNKKLSQAVYRGATNGCSVHLFPATGDTLAVTEGVETGLAVHEATGVPVWVGGNAGLVGKIEVPDHIKTVELWADNDANGTGIKAAHKAARRHHQAGRTVFILLPVTVGEDWLDVFAREGKTALMQTRDEATAWTPANEPTSDFAINEKPDDPHRLASLFVGQHQYCSEPTLRWWNQLWLRWHEGVYATWPDKEMRAALYCCVRREFERIFTRQMEVWQRSGGVDENGKEVAHPTIMKISKNLLGDVVEALQSLTVIPGKTEIPAWLGTGTAPRDWIACRNGVLDVDALLSGNLTPMRPLSPTWFTLARLPYDFNPQAECPTWLKFVGRNLGDDIVKQRLLQQWFGYCLVFDLSYQKFLLLRGEGSNGKSVICAALEAMLGADNISSVPLELFGDKFRLAGTLGKLANIAAEVGEMDRVTEGLLKAYVAGDSIEFERKFKDPFRGRPTARLAFSTNNPPAFGDKSDGLWRRMLLLNITVKILDGEKILNMDKPFFWESERAGILNWALAGLHDLRQSKGFVIPADAQVEIERMRSTANPTRVYLREHWQAATIAEDSVASATVYSYYRDWCANTGHASLSQEKFTTEVFRMFPKVEHKKRGPRDHREWRYIGLETKKDDPDDKG